MRISTLWFIGIVVLSGSAALASNESNSAQVAKARLAALPRISAESWKSLLSQHGWLYGNVKAKIKVVGILDPSASLVTRNLLFGSPNRESDYVCKTLLLPSDTSPNWNTMSKLRVAYALMEPTKYRVPNIILNQAKQVAEPKPGDLDREWAAVPDDIKKQAETEVAGYAEIAKRVKVNAYYVVLPNDEVVEVNHPFEVERVWNDYLTSKSS